MESILTSTKKMLGIVEDYTHFDTDLIIHINSVFGILNQLGVGPSEGFIITGKNEEWSDFISDRTDLEMVKSYVVLKVRLIFDPPTSSATMEAMKHLVSEMEFRLNVAVDPSPAEE